MICFTTLTTRNAWPVKLSARRALGYLGDGINDREFSGNNMDYAGSNSRYGKRYYLNRYVILNLNRTNISVVAADRKYGGFKNADFLFTKNTSFRQEIIVHRNHRSAVPSDASGWHATGCSRRRTLFWRLQAQDQALHGF
jgi:hypothetical protein